MIVQKCTNCGSLERVLLNKAFADKHDLLTSDVKYIESADAERYLCRNCGVVEIVFSVNDAIEKFYAREYEINDIVQNHYVVINEKASGKHSFIYESVYSEIRGKKIRNGKYLEIACGTGELIKECQRLFPEWTFTGVEPSDKCHMKLSGNERISFVKDFFPTDRIKHQHFDFIVAHGLLNRTAPYPCLQSIANVCVPGTILSIELMLLEQSECAPYIWDHTYMYTADVIREYLNACGFSIVSDTDLGSSHHYICRYNGTGSLLIELSNTVVKQSQEVFSCHLLWWENKIEKYHKFKGMYPSGIALFGAGMYSAILINKSKEKPAFIIDELKKNTVFYGVNVYGFESIPRNDIQVLLCTRPAYVTPISDKLIDNNIKFSIL